ncbi:hypothetical protein JNK62_00605 [bacterium]|nr:hypothetical protein [bacterium]
MELSIFLAKLFGLYFLIAGGIIMMRQRSFMPIFTEILGSRPLLLILGVAELLAGLAIVIAHPIFTATWQGLLTLVGAWMAVEGIIYLAMPYTKVGRLMRQFNTPTWYTSGGLVAIVMGGYLAGKGFGLW